MITFTHSHQETESRIIDEASQNPTFRQRLLADPKAALSEFFDMTLPEGMKISVLEEEPGHHYLVLPPATPPVNALPLDDLALALVGGGRTLRPDTSSTKSNTEPPNNGEDRRQRITRRRNSC